MNAKKYFAPTAREALRRVKEELGADAIVLSNQTVEGGVEITAVLSSEINAMQAAATLAPSRAPMRAPTPSPMQPASPRATSFSTPGDDDDNEADDQDDAFTVSLSRNGRNAAPAKDTQSNPDLKPSLKPSLKPIVRAWSPNQPTQRERENDALNAARKLAAISTAQPASRPVNQPTKQPASARKIQESEPLVQSSQPTEQTHVMRELNAIKGLIEQQLTGFAWADLSRGAPLKTLLLTEMLDVGFSAQLARRLVEGLPDNLNNGTSREAGRTWLKGVLNRSLTTMSLDEEIIDRGGVYALVGPTGVGKTTTTAKLAARCVVRHGAESVALLTTDGYRIGAHEQLRIYGRILGVSVHAVRDAADLRQTLAELSGKHMVLIDTIGMSQRDQLVAEQAAMLNHAGDVRRLLLLNATCRGDTLDDVINNYGGAAMAGAILTKVDEAVSLAPAIDALIRHNLDLYYVTNGQRVPEDLHIPNRAYLLHRALKEQTETSPHRLIGDEAGLLMATKSSTSDHPVREVTRG